jgi:asparagine synthase (glutamine-hydrolysing)
MCGIAGIFSFSQALNTAHIEGMVDALVARGPDDRGVWLDAEQGIALGHRRLSIIDLSPLGHQPMFSASGRYVISYNGELYNYRELRAQLDYPWHSESDTEVLLAAIEQWGIEKALPKLNGMFAFAIWDKQEQTLSLARDRMGEKPLYYGWVGKQFVFASELKAFHNLPGWPPAINREALYQLMQYSYIPAPHSIYKNISKLEPGFYLSIATGQQTLEPKAYWSYEAMVKENISKRVTYGEKEAADQLEAKLKYAVGQRMVADVGLGAFLSGGIDSSSIVALMQVQSTRPIETFTIGFEERGFDEAPYAKAVAEHLHTAHTELYVSSAKALDVIPKLSNIYDEPFADPSQIPTYLVSQLARQTVTVALSGDGGDELFGGYNRHFRGPGLWNILSAIPLPLRKIAALYNDKLDAISAEDFYRKLASTNANPEKVIKGSIPPLPQGGNTLNHPFAEWMMLQDGLTYFPGDILTKVDRAAMSVGLETRTPFTDPALMAFAWQLPLDMKIRDGKGKWLLRQVLSRYVPEKLIERPKAGFAIPVGQWLRGPLRSWAEDLLSPETLRQQELLNADAVQKLWLEHQLHLRNNEKQLWTILMFQSWLSNA